ncbi:MAG: cupin domain-containing protein [Oscillospiraceae bacterium]|nr:cupin domain-containing protein [Oscillospiraceae bacterium]MBQ8670615.1 cupin domain-containing protein [Oscillospiraceae bacterium]MBQ8918129.1 cupin domain-containing protein [Oscillospiraceae bacterium]MBQ9109252.1 cupin domain-containing protein [Oscillospiraceae bacterium]
MNNQMEQIAARIKELREILEYTEEEVAQEVGVSLEDYRRYEQAVNDVPISTLYAIADKLGVDPTVLMTGDAPRMAEYTVVRQGKGVSVERYEGYKFTALAANYIGRELDPMIVDISPSDGTPKLVTHGGQEFNYVLEGRIVVTIGKQEFTLEAGDSIYFNPRIPHGQHAEGVPSRFLTIINE